MGFKITALCLVSLSRVNQLDLIMLLISCREKLAIIIPFKDRDTHLRTLLYYLHPFLMKQKLHYCIYIIEQVRHIKKIDVKNKVKPNCSV